MLNEFRLTDYLARIGFRGKVQPDLATLVAIHAAHVDAIPFEGIDPLLSRAVKLDLASVQEKLLDRRRGGYCFEQNALFSAALEAIGFNVTGLGGGCAGCRRPTVRSVRRHTCCSGSIWPSDPTLPMSASASACWTRHCSSRPTSSNVRRWALIG